MKIVPMSVELVDHMGSDLSVVNAARVSFNKQVEEFNPRDEKLIRYLADHNHWTPFAHIFASFRIKTPLFVARQLGKHQVGLVWNEVSRRYVDEEPEFWYPDVWRGRPINAKQGSDGVVALKGEGTDYTPMMILMERTLDTYNGLLKEGVAPEQARMVLPQNMMTEWIWSGSIMAFARVCNLRRDAHAQEEVRTPSLMISEALKAVYPVSWAHLVKEYNTPT